MIADYNIARKVSDFFLSQLTLAELRCFVENIYLCSDNLLSDILGCRKASTHPFLSLLSQQFS
jgi:hypothetical protein